MYYIQNNGKYILWSHLKTIHKEMQSDTGLYIGKRLTLQHVELTSFSRMRVDLAAQVSTSQCSPLYTIHMYTPHVFIAVFIDPKYYGG